MKDKSGQLVERSIIDIIRSIYLERLTGILEIEHDESRKRFDFVGGELHLAGGHPLAQRLVQFLERGRPPRATSAPESSQSGSRRSRLSPEVRSELQQLVGRIVEMLIRLDHGTYLFSEDFRALPSDLVGPLPTSYLVMEGAIYGLGDAQLLRSLGGDQAIVVANRESEVLDRLYEIDPEEMFLLSRAEEPITVATLCRQMSQERTSTLRQLCRFQALDLIRQAGEPENGHQVQDEESAVDQTVVARFLERIEGVLRREPLEMARDEHRKWVVELLRKLGGMSHYELLEVDFHAASEDVHRRFDWLARRVHPLHAVGLDLPAGTLRMAFEQATAAYLTLTDTERRQQYNQQAGIAAEEAERYRNLRNRDDEQKEVARANYERAVELVAAEDYHFALELVRQSLRIDPQPEYYALQGSIQSKNPHWLNGAVESYRQAVKLEPTNAEVRLALARLLEMMGSDTQARAQYKAVLDRIPHHAEAQEALKRLRASAPLEPSATSESGSKKSVSSWLNRLLGR